MRKKAALRQNVVPWILLPQKDLGDWLQRSFGSPMRGGAQSPFKLRLASIYLVSSRAPQAESSVEALGVRRYFSN